MTYADMFSKVKGMMMEADVSTVNEHLAYQFNVTGEAEGIFYAEVKEGKLYVEPYEYYDRDAIFICSAETLFKINEGKLDPVLAVTLGKLKVEGNIDIYAQGVDEEIANRDPSIGNTVDSVCKFRDYAFAELLKLHKLL